MADETKKPEPASVKIELVKELKLPTAVLALDAAPDGRILFAACLDGGIYEVSLESGEHRRLAKHNSYASGVTFLPKTGLVISGGYDGQLLWLDPRELKTVRSVAAHQFWSWQMALSPDERLVASVTGQYLAGGYKYEPAPETEPSVKVFDTQTGELRWSFSHGPPVLSVAFSPDAKVLAAANMMGEIRVWDLHTGKELAAWTTPVFTSWGIIKSHHYVGGIFGLAFSPDSSELLACGMGPMNDPMAGNGKQTWQRFAWQENPPRKTTQIRESDNGNGLMETITFHPGKPFFLMAGRLAQGKWNVGFFDAASGSLIHSADTKMRISDAVFSADGNQLFLAGASSQEKKKDGKYPEFGRLRAYRCSDA
jgi:WD40 repeat protein